MSVLAAAVVGLVVLNIGLSLAVLALARQVGVLFERIAPMGALSLRAGPAVGETAPALRLRALDGRVFSLAQAGPRSRMLFFLSPTCPVCKKLLPALRAMARAEADVLEILLASDGEEAEQRDFVARERLEFPYILSAELGLAFQVAKLPYAVLIGADGVVRAKGLVNTREQLESLLEAQDRGVASLQAYAARLGEKVA